VGYSTSLLLEITFDTVVDLDCGEAVECLYFTLLCQPSLGSAHSLVAEVTSGTGQYSVLLFQLNVDTVYNDLCALVLPPSAQFQVKPGKFHCFILRFSDRDISYLL
jgi:hypothetical protein